MLPINPILDDLILVLLQESKHWLYPGLLSLARTATLPYGQAVLSTHSDPITAGSKTNLSFAEQIKHLLESFDNEHSPSLQSEWQSKQILLISGTKRKNKKRKEKFSCLPKY